MKKTRRGCKKMVPDWYKALSEEEKNKKESILEIGIGICLKKRNKNKRMHERIVERIQRKLIQQWAQENKKNNDELKSAGVYVITDFIKDKVKCSTDNDDVVDFDDDDDDDDDDDNDDNEQDSVVRFRWKWHSDSWQWVYLFSVSSLISMIFINWVFLYDKIYKKWVRITMKILVCLLFYFTFLDFVCTL